MRAMILTAGLGTRLRPLTEALPKPLLPLANRPLIRHHLELLRAAGVLEVVLNLHHLPEAIPQALGGGSALGMHLTYSREVEILDTGGGIKAASAFLREPGEPFFVLNGDLLIDVSLEAVLETHRQSGAMATMVLREDRDAARFGVLGVGADGRILDFVGRARYPGDVVRQGLFTGIHVLEPGVLDLIPSGPCGINTTAYPQMVRDGVRVQSHFQRGFWSDVGTPERYLAAHLAVLEQQLVPVGPAPFAEAGWAHDGERSYGDPSRVTGLSGARIEPPVILGTGVVLEPGVVLGPAVSVGDGSRIGAGAEVRRSLVWPGASIGAQARIFEAVVWRAGEETRILPVSLDPA